MVRSRYYQRACRAIRTGHSNRRRTQTPDFEDLEIAFPINKDEQRRLIAGIVSARKELRNANERLRQELLKFSNLIDGRGTEELAEIDSEQGIRVKD